MNVVVVITLKMSGKQGAIKRVKTHGFSCFYCYLS